MSFPKSDPKVTRYQVRRLLAVHTDADEFLTDLPTFVPIKRHKTKLNDECDVQDYWARTLDRFADRKVRS